jgi:hypothetical protein
MYITPKFGGQRADIAVYDEKHPAVVVGVKIVDERRRLSMEQSLGSTTIGGGQKTATLAGEWGWRFVCVKLA